MKLKTLISRPILLVAALQFIVGLTVSNAQTDTVNLQRHDVNLLINNLELQTKLNANFKSGFDTLRRAYNDAVDSLNQYVAYLQSCMNDRDRAIRKIDTLRTDLSKAWVETDKANAKYDTEHAKKKKDAYIAAGVGYNPFNKRAEPTIGVYIPIVGFHWPKIFDNSGNTKSAQQTGGTLSDKLRGGY